MYTERNKKIMREFEKMINTADEGLAEKLVAAEGMIGIIKAWGLFR